MLNLGIVVNGVLLVFGALWCHGMFGRWREDLDAYKNAKDASAQQTVIVLWGITAIVALLMLNFAIEIVRDVVR